MLHGDARVAKLATAEIPALSVDGAFEEASAAADAAVQSKYIGDAVRRALEPKPGGWIFAKARGEPRLGAAALPFERSLYLLVQVVSIASQAKQRRAVGDAGFKAGFPANGGLPRCVSHPRVRVADLNAEHTHLDVTDAADLALGERLLLQPYYSDATTCLHRAVQARGRVGVVGLEQQPLAERQVGGVGHVEVRVLGVEVGDADARVRDAAGQPAIRGEAGLEPGVADRPPLLGLRGDADDLDEEVEAALEGERRGAEPRLAASLREDPTARLGLQGPPDGVSDIFRLHRCIGRGAGFLEGAVDAQRRYLGRRELGDAGVAVQHFEQFRQSSLL